MARLVTRLLTRGYGFLDGVLEPPPLAIPQEGLQVPGASVFGTVVVDLFEALETCGPCLGQMVVGHVRFPLLPVTAPQRAVKKWELAPRGTPIPRSWNRLARSQSPFFHNLSPLAPLPCLLAPLLPRHRRGPLFQIERQDDPVADLCALLAKKVPEAPGPAVFGGQRADSAPLRRSNNWKRPRTPFFNAAGMVITA